VESIKSSLLKDPLLDGDEARERVSGWTAGVELMTCTLMPTDQKKKNEPWLSTERKVTRRLAKE
jgi:hypothetical protein